MTAAPPGVTIRALRPDEVDAALEVIARSFHDDPGALIIEPDPARRRDALRHLTGPVVRAALPHGHVAAAVTPDGTIVGVATWLPPGHDAPTDAELREAGLDDAEAAVPDAAARMGPMAAALDRLHERSISGDHWRLEFFGVDPAWQGTGLGAALIETGHRHADAAGQLCWLETFTRRNVDWYARRGYRVAAQGTVPTGEPIWGLIRDPRRPAQAG
jgi:GNAT superfamily N-acetyltransferase